MKKTFYQGQTDYLDKLNELSGRGAVVASYNPAPGMAPQGEANGRITPAWIDPNITFGSNRPVSILGSTKFGYEFASGGNASALYYKIALLPASTLGTLDHLLIKGVLCDGWGAPNAAAFEIRLGNRGAFSYDWHSDNVLFPKIKILAIKEASGDVSVYLHFVAGVFATASFSMSGIGCTTYAEPALSTTMPDGDIIFDSSTSAPRWCSTPAKDTLFSRAGVVIGDGTPSSTSFAIPVGAKGTELVEIARLGVGRTTGVAYPGFWGIGTSTGHANFSNYSAGKEGYHMSFRAYDVGSSSFTDRVLALHGDGKVYVAYLKAGLIDNNVYHSIAHPLQVQGNVNLAMNNCAAFYVASGGYGNPAATSMVVNYNNNTGRSINAGGTVNASGTDYAEYMRKAPHCGGIEKGAIAGIDAAGALTDQWRDAVAFVVKSTNPSYVGGDTWAAHLGERPKATAGVAPLEPVRPFATATSGADQDNDREWAGKQAAYAAALSSHAAAVAADSAAGDAFDALMESERQKVDRIAFSGQVPVNVYGATPGHYIVPVQEGDAIAGIAMNLSDMSMEQYAMALGKVIAIEDDGRARIIVKVA